MLKRLEQRDNETWYEFVTRVRAYQAKITDKRTRIVFLRDQEPGVTEIETI